MLHALRRRYVTDPLFAWARKNLPSLSATEREALEARPRRARLRAGS
jgi:hypothetical protein